jgi:hypothetical protein
MTTKPKYELPVETIAASPSGRERRKRERRPFTVMQRVAPCPDGRAPAEYTFSRVRCHDISRSGISFDTTQPPLHEYFVIALGDGPATIYVRARVANSMRIMVGKTPMFRVDCEFLERMHDGA